MVGIAQLVERLVVVQEVAGSSPVTHPNRFKRRGMPIEMSEEDFEALVADELDALPDEMMDGLENVQFSVEDRPEDGTLSLFGLYHGIALTHREHYGFGELPDLITIYRDPHLAHCDDVDELRDQIHVTLVHEIGHFYGMDDEQLHELGWG